MSKSIKETRELVKAVAGVVTAVMADLADGKLSTWEIVTLVSSNLGAVREAIQGIGEIPGELADLDNSERETLLGDIGAAMTGAGLSHRVSDAAEKVLTWAWGTVQTFVEIKNAPPAAAAA